MQSPINLKLSIFTIFLCLILASSGCDSGSDYKPASEISDSQDVIVDSNSKSNTEILVPNPPLSLGFFPCSECHADMEVNTQRRDLVEMHDDIVFNHDSENRWCLACHDAQNRDSLRLASGRLLSFKKSYELCGQCHGPKYRDWKLGIHGKRTGEWNGKKQYLLCVHCHDPHSPKFKSLKPLPPPRKPVEIKLDSLNE